MPPRRFIDKKTSRTFQLCHKNYDDVTYEDEKSKGTLALRRVGGRTVLNEPNFEREWGIVPTYNMLEVDDTVDTMESDANCMFRDAEWGAFDQDWIRVMCEKPEDESTAVLDMTRYPCHDPALATSHLDQVYARQMEDFDLDYDLDQEDERLQGPLPIEAYEAALDEWIDETKKVNFLDRWEGEDREIGADRSGGVRFLMPTILREHAFHEDAQGVYLTVLQSRKHQSPFVDYHRERKAALRLTRERVAMYPEAVACEEFMDEEAVLEEMFPDRPPEVWDCETILTTYSNLENHPELIKDEPLRKIKLSAKTGLPRAPLPPSAAKDSDDSDDDLAERVSLLTSTTSMGRPRDETSCEKRERKKLIKAGKQLRREQKKELKGLFSVEGVSQRWELLNAEAQRQKMTLGQGRSTL